MDLEGDLALGRNLRRSELRRPIPLWPLRPRGERETRTRDHQPGTKLRRTRHVEPRWSVGEGTGFYLCCDDLPEGVGKRILSGKGKAGAMPAAVGLESTVTRCPRGRS